jgi:hypothetical protein
VHGIGPCGTMPFTGVPLRTYRDFMTADEGRFRLCWFGKMNRGILPAHHFGSDVWIISALASLLR